MGCSVRHTQFTSGGDAGRYTKAAVTAIHFGTHAREVVGVGTATGVSSARREFGAARVSGGVGFTRRGFYATPRILRAERMSSTA